ncbi:MAG TPA: glutamyl-tRNA reductase [Candidatus Sulfotelmatobacter sp.]|nr:glutamyl-tRNA reductase [Candidatus Sulfotelmatobacter sp.]
MAIVVLGLNHKTAPVEVRERLHIAEKDLPDSLDRLGALPETIEGVILSTCNRVEIYSVVADGPAARGPLQGFLAAERVVPVEAFAEACYLHQDQEAVRHAFRVASSLDSLVVGEGQILAQVKAAYAAAARQGATGPILNALMERTLHVAKQVRTETGIGSVPVSVASVAVDLARRIFSDLAGRTVMILGAGEMAELALTHLKDEGIQTILVANRNHERAVELAGRVGGRAIKFDHARDVMVDTDIVLSSTAAPHVILGPDDMTEVVRRRHYRPIFLIDIAVPRDIDPRVNDLDNVYLYDIDDLEAEVAANLSSREREAVRAEAIVDREVVQFMRWLQSLDVVPTIISLRERFEGVRQAELEKALGRLGDLRDDQREAVAALTASIINKLLHQPMTELKRQASSRDGHHYAAILRALFRLEEPPKE